MDMQEVFENIGPCSIHQEIPEEKTVEKPTSTLTYIGWTSAFYTKGREYGLTLPKVNYSSRIVYLIRGDDGVVHRVSLSFVLQHFREL